VLNPKKAKELIKPTAEKTLFNEDLVNAVISFYWTEVRKSLSTLKHSRIHITNLGNFTVKHWKIDDKIKSLEAWEETNKQKGLQQITARFKTAETLYDLKNLNKIILEENQRKDFIKLHKTKANVKSGKKHNKNMEEQESNS
jgi:nucleoid DNA-binding protein